jgi:MFS family permease
MSKRVLPSWAVLAVCCVAQFMVVLDVSIVNVALPKMRADLDLSATGQQWIINAYTLTFAGFLLLGGRAADLFGRRRVFLLGLGVFTAFSLLGGLAQNGGSLIAARAVQGVGGAILAPATLSLLTTTFIEPAARRRALGAWSATAASGAAAGVLAGGLLTDLLDWRWVLLVNVPIGAALIAAAMASLAESKADTRPSLDIAGAVTVTGGLALLVYGIVSTDTRSWGSPATILTLLGGAALLATFIVIETRTANPLVPLQVFRLRSVAAANGIAVMLGAALFSSFFFLSLYLQQVNGYSPLKAGVAFLPLALATLTGALAAPPLVTPHGRPPPTDHRTDDRGGRARVVEPTLRRRRLLRPRLRSPRDHRPGLGPHVRADDNRCDGRRPATSSRTGLRAHQHDPAGRRRGGPGRHGHRRRPRVVADRRLRPRVLDLRGRPGDRSGPGPGTAGQAQGATARHQPRGDDRARGVGRRLAVRHTGLRGSSSVPGAEA